MGNGKELLDFQVKRFESTRAVPALACISRAMTHVEGPAVPPVKASRSNRLTFPSSLHCLGTPCIYDLSSSKKQNKSLPNKPKK
jgi:hypothetical protein